MARRPETSHRHTVPNSSYASFPCFQEELKLKTNLIKCDTGEEMPDGGRENFQVNVSMHDKLKMCFAEMENVKDQFDSRRKKGSPKKRATKERSESNTPETNKSRANSSLLQNDTQPSPGAYGKRPFDSNLPNTAQSEGENKFKAHLIRTSSKDSMESAEKENVPQSVEMLRHTAAYEEPFLGATTSQAIQPDSLLHLRRDVNRRTVSDPFGNLGLLSRGQGDPLEEGFPKIDSQSVYGTRHSEKPFREAPFNWRPSAAKTRFDELAQSKSAETRRSYDDWLQKLDEVNDISRSTLKRIRHLEGEMTTLRMATDNLSCRQKPGKPFASRIPVTTIGSPHLSVFPNVPSRSPLPTKKYSDKCTNTDIDLKFMDDLLKHWKSKSPMAEFSDRSSSNDHSSRVARRRLTTTIGRSVEIQTEFEHKSCQEKGISTEDWPIFKSTPSEKEEDISEGAPKEASTSENQTAQQSSSNQMSILDMPNVENGQPRYFGSFIPDQTSRRNAKTPEPIVEIYSDSEDTSFDDFEKNMYNQISKRALIQSRLAARKDAARMSAMESDIDLLKLRNSSTQTNGERARHSPPQPMIEGAHLKPKSADIVPPSLVVPTNLRSTSKIVIERVRMNQKEKSEIVLKTDIDKEGVVSRTTEVKNRKFRAKEQSSPRKEPLFESSTEPRKKHLRKVNSDMNVRHSRNCFSRPVSEMDIPNSEFGKKKGDNFFYDKALSSIDIAAKSPVSEGYYSEYLDQSCNRMNGTPVASQEFLIQPPKSFQTQETIYGDPWEEVSKSEVTNKTVNDTMDAFKEMELARQGFLTLTNETVIDNTGKQTNITTKSRTIRKYKPKEQAKSTLDLSQSEESPVGLSSSDLCRSQSTSQFNLNSLQPIDADPPLYYGETLDDLPQQQHRSLARKEPSQPSMCNFSLVYNYDNNLVFKANFGLAKLPRFETNL